jgi:hypothetical protein
VFDNKTVFLLGAGASWHYGYPTGEELAKKVAVTAKELGEFCKTHFRQGFTAKKVHETCTRHWS